MAHQVCNDIRCETSNLEVDRELESTCSHFFNIYIYIYMCYITYSSQQIDLCFWHFICSSVRAGQTWTNVIWTDIWFLPHEVGYMAPYLTPYVSTATRMESLTKGRVCCRICMRNMVSYVVPYIPLYMAGIICLSTWLFVQVYLAVDPALTTHPLPTCVKTNLKHCLAFGSNSKSLGGNWLECDE